MTLNSNNVCDKCHGIVKNIAGKRHSITKLTAIHRESCPGQTPLRRGTKTQDEEETEAPVAVEAPKKQRRLRKKKVQR